MFRIGEQIPLDDGLDPRLPILRKLFPAKCNIPILKIEEMHLMHSIASFHHEKIWISKMILLQITKILNPICVYIKFTPIALYKPEKGENIFVQNFGLELSS
jgi:hypothetical protein